MYNGVRNGGCNTQTAADGSMKREKQTGKTINLHDRERERQTLRSEIAKLLEERDNLLYVRAPHIEAAYCLKFGEAEYKVHELRCDTMRAKRKIELIRASLNRQEPISAAAIEERLDREFYEYKERLDDWLNKINDALTRSRGESLTKEETAEIKRLYRTIMKALHPDLNPGESDSLSRLFHNAVAAYEAGDLEALRLIASVTENRTTVADIPAAELTEREIRRLQTLSESLRNEIGKIESQYPFTLQPFLDGAAAEEKRRELENERLQLTQILETYRETIRSLTGENNE